MVITLPLQIWRDCYRVRLGAILPCKCSFKMKYDARELALIYSVYLLGTGHKAWTIVLAICFNPWV